MEETQINSTVNQAERSNPFDNMVIFTW